MKKLFLTLVCLVCLLALAACRSPQQPQQPSHTHSLTFVEGVEPSCTESGSRAHWACGECKKLFADEAAETELREADLSLPRAEHTDVVRDFRCDECNASLMTRELLQGMIDAAFARIHVVVNELDWTSNSDTLFAFHGDAIFIVTENGEEIISAENEGDVLNMGYIFRDRFDFSIASDVMTDTCPIGDFTDRATFEYINESGTKIAWVPDATMSEMEGFLIYDESNNIIRVCTITEPTAN